MIEIHLDSNLWESDLLTTSRALWIPYKISVLAKVWKCGVPLLYSSSLNCSTGRRNVLVPFLFKVNTNIKQMLNTR